MYAVRAYLFIFSVFVLGFSYDRLIYLSGWLINGEFYYLQVSSSCLDRVKLAFSIIYKYLQIN